MPEQPASDVEQARAVLSDISSFRSIVGGLEFYGASSEFHAVIEVCKRNAAEVADEQQAPNKAYLFIEDYHGKTALAKATDLEARTNQLASHYLDGTAGPTQKTLLDLRDEKLALIIVDGLPEPANQRRTVLERFNSLTGRGLLFCRPEYSSDANLSMAVQRFHLSHVDQRWLDKLAWLVGMTLESLRDSTGRVPPSLSRAVGELPARTLVSLANVRMSGRVKDIPVLANRIAETVRLRSELAPITRIDGEDVASIFVEFFSPQPRPGPPGFRLWVEGESDCRILKLVARTVANTHSLDFDQGLLIMPLGIGREGGTSKISEVVISNQTRRNNDLFLLDFDEPGRHAEEELHALKQDVMLLNPRLSCSRHDGDIEIEDYIALGCLDEFYETNQSLRPEKEILRYKSPLSRRIVVDGVDKEALVEWLEKNASPDDLENLFVLLCDIRTRFSLRNPVDSEELQQLHKKLQNEFVDRKHMGRRPQHW
jgi:hypothetical protein